MPFAKNLAAALEKQDEDDTLRWMLCKQLAGGNSNSECQKIIDALPGNPMLADMVNACAKTGSVDHRVSARVAALQPDQTPLGDGQQKKSKNKGKTKQGICKPTGPGATFLCSRCLREGHCSNQCKAKFRANGQPLTGPRNRKTSTERNCALTRVIP